MQSDPKIIFRGVKGTEALSAFIKERVLKLERYKKPITHCHVVVEKSDGRRNTGSRFVVHLELTVPGGDIVVTHREGGARRRAPAGKVSRSEEPFPGHTHVREAVRDVFAVAKRRLQEFARRQRGE